MTSTCNRCNGNILIGHDPAIGEYYEYCLQCGNRPQYANGRADGLPLEAAPKCRNCGQRDAYLAWNTVSRAYVYQAKCEVCRARKIESKKIRRRGAYASKANSGA